MHAYLLHAALSASCSTCQQVEGSHSILRKLLTLSLTNPKAFLFYVSFFVQFIDFNYAHIRLPFTILALSLGSVSFIYMTTLIRARDVGARLQP